MNSRFLLVFFISFHLLGLYCQAQALDCSLDSGSTSVPIQGQQCQCLQQHSWDPSKNKCIPNCNTRFAARINPDNDLQCLCETGTIWNSRLKLCMLDCQNILYSTGQWLSEYSCECTGMNVWNLRTLRCDPKCELQPLSTGILLSDGTCECVQEVSVWNDDKGICERDCSLVSGSRFPRPDENGNCICEGENLWLNGACQVLQCSDIPYVDLTAPQPDQKTCACQADFMWDSTLTLCVINCADIPSPALDTRVDLYACLCEDGSYWQPSALRCFIDCSTVANALPKNVNAQQCFCQEDYVWSVADQQCVTTCGQKVGELATFNTELNRCDCLDGFEYYSNSPEGGACYRSCQELSKTQGAFGSTPNSCKCVEGFAWSDTNLLCEILCLGPYDLGVDSEDSQRCQCKVDTTIFVPQIGTCMPFCINDPLSTGSYNSDTFGCKCKVNAHWNRATALCEENVVSSSAIPSIAMGAGGGIAALFSAGIVYRYKNKKEQEKKPEEGSETKIRNQQQCLKCDI